jgi:hypothetical protein
MQKPECHKPIPLQTRVIVHETYIGLNRESYAGRVVGICKRDFIYTYIVLLDVPIWNKHEGLAEAVCVDGINLMNEHGVYEWRWCPGERNGWIHSESTYW